MEILEDRTLLTAGSLDPTFGSGGEVTTYMAGGITGLVLQPDGKLVAAGGAVLERYNADGTPDSSFGSGGQVTANAQGLALQTDGKIIACGNTVDRFLPNGTLDPSFGNGGQATLSASLVALQADGKIVIAAGWGVVARLNTNGTIDTTFGTNGVAIGPPLVQDYVGMGIEPDGRIVVLTASPVRDGPGGNLVGFSSAGILDAGFGSGGITATPQADRLQGLTVLPDGRILVAGTFVTGPGSRDFAILRYFANGVLDASFGTNGETLTNLFTFQQANAVAVQPDGRYVAAGFAANNLNNGFALARYNPNGSLDTTFGAGGMLSNAFPGGTYGVARANQVLVLPDGQVVAAGGLPVGTIYTRAEVAVLARYTSDTPLPTANQRFVAQAYLDLLGRPVDGAGLAQWGNLLDQGTSRMQVVLDIQSSPEFLAYTANSLYSRYLHRIADPIGLNDSVSFLRSGGTVERLIDVLVSSPEFLQGQGKGTRDGFLDALYQDALNRAVEPGGRAAWDRALASGRSYAQVAADILASPEYRRDLVTEAYEFFLRRRPDPAGLNTFTTPLALGILDGEVLATIVGSPEYFQRI